MMYWVYFVSEWVYTVYILYIRLIKNVQISDTVAQPTHMHIRMPILFIKTRMSKVQYDLFAL